MLLRRKRRQLLPPLPLQVVTSIGELVEVCSAQIQSGWRPLFSALETVHSGNKSEVKEYLVGEYSMGKTVCGFCILKLVY